MASLVTNGSAAQLQGRPIGLEASGIESSSLGRAPIVFVDHVEENRWSEICGKFGDASIYQTWPYEAARSSVNNISHLWLEQNSTVLAAAQSRIVRVPYSGLGMAYVRWGPLWSGSDGTENPEIFRLAIRALRAEYVDRRGLCLRIVPRLERARSDSIQRLLEEENYILQPHAKEDRTILMDIEPALGELHEGLHQKWRYHLNKARKQNLEVVSGSEDSLFEGFAGIYAQMVARKGLADVTDITKVRMIQKRLKPEEKMRVFLCKKDGEICAGGIGTALGRTGIYLYGASSDQGLKTYGSYLVHWNLLEWMKQSGCALYDLNGINPVTNPGGYQFKTQLAGKHGKEVTFLGQFDAYPNSWVRTIVGLADSVRAILRQRRPKNVS